MRLALALAACGTWMTGVGAASAASLSGVEVEGLHLGMAQRTVSERYPYMHYESVPYIDPDVGDRYQIILGSVAVERIDGHAIEERGDQVIAVDTTFTGDGSLTAVTARVEHKAGECGAVAQAMRADYGEPTIDNAPGELTWIDKGFGVHRSLRFTCYDQRSYSLTLTDHQAQAENLRTIRERLEPYILETLQRVH